MSLAGGWQMTRHIIVVTETGLVHMSFGTDSPTWYRKEWLRLPGSEVPPRQTGACGRC